MANHGPPGRKRFSDGGGAGGGGHDDQGWRKKPRFDDVPPATLRVLIRNSEAGGIIGKGGENIKRLRKQYDCQVVLPDSAGAPERVMTMMGTIHSCVGVLGDVLESLGSDYRGGGGSRDGNKELQVLIPQPFMGTIIGTGGSKIKELRIRTAATIKIFSDPMPGSNERSVQLVGSRDQIVECVQHFLDDISKKEPREPIYLYEPHISQFDSPPFDSARGSARGRGNSGFNRGRGRGRGGGFGGDSGGSWRGRGGGGARGGRGGGRNQYNGSNSRYSYGGSGHHSSQQQQSFQSPSGPPPPLGGGDTGAPPVGYGTPQQPPPVGYTAPPTQATPPTAIPGMVPPNPSSQPPPTGGGGVAVGGSPQVFPSQGAQAPPPQFGGTQQSQYPKPSVVPPTSGSGTGPQSQQVTIPDVFADAILGPGGSRLQQIKSQSSCDITLEPASAGSNERIITITGSSSGIQFAQQLMQNSVRQHHNV